MGVVFDRDGLWSNPGFDLQTPLRGDLEQVEQTTGGQQTVDLGALPASCLGHVEEAWMAKYQLGRVHYQERRPVMLRVWKRVEIKVTGAPATCSISSMKRMVRSLSCSKRRAF